MDNSVLLLLRPTYMAGAAKVRRDNAWDFRYGFPFPAWDLKCPVCGAKHYDGGIQVRHWKFHRHSSSSGSKHPERVDVSFKCRVCANVWFHGVKCPKALYEWHERTMYKFREVDAIIHKQQIPKDVIDAVVEESTHLFDN